MGTIRLELRSQKVDKIGKSPILLNYQVKGQRKYFNTGKKAFKISWDPDGQRLIYLDKKTVKIKRPDLHYDLFPTSKEVDDFNNFLVGKIAQIKRIEDRFE